MGQKRNRVIARLVLLATVALAAIACGPSPEGTFKQLRKIAATGELGRFYDRYLASDCKKRMSRMNALTKANASAAALAAKQIGWTREQYVKSSDREIFLRKLEVLTTGPRAIVFNADFASATIVEVERTNGRATVRYRTPGGREGSITMVREGRRWKVLLEM